ncbi:MAG: hypothetical protein MJE66_25250 [Proteobacteria bacterium]|nr:hypothetical protein [Pseudomonadota bacterium]
MEIVLGLLLVAAVAAALYFLWPVNRSNAHGLTLLCPIQNGSAGGQSYDSIVRKRLQELEIYDQSPFARVPSIYLCRGYVLSDVFYQGGEEVLNEHLASKYLVFSTNYHGDLEAHLDDLWNQAGDAVRHLWEHCVGFDEVSGPDSFRSYIRRCQVKTTFFFNGSTDEPRDEQLKALYLKQAFSDFAFANQGKTPEALQREFRSFLERTQPDAPHPRWVAGSAHGQVTSP